VVRRQSKGLDVIPMTRQICMPGACRNHPLFAFFSFSNQMESMDQRPAPIK
jgi:hypothetical protein